MDLTWLSPHSTDIGGTESICPNLPAEIEGLTGVTDGVISGESFRRRNSCGRLIFGGRPVGCDGHSGMLSTIGPEQSPGDSAGGHAAGWYGPQDGGVKASGLSILWR